MGARTEPLSQSRRPRPLDQPFVEDRCLMFGQITGRPADTVLAMQFSGQGLAGERAVKALLEEPGRILSVSIEPNTEVTVTEQVVHGAESVVGTPDLTSHRRMKAVRFPCDRGDLQDPVSSDRGDEFVCIAVRPR